MSVYRIYVEKKEPFAVEAAGVLASLRNDLGLSKLRHVRLLNRYDVEGISREVFDSVRDTVFSEPPVDMVYDELPAGDGKVFAIEYLPGQSTSGPIPAPSASSSPPCASVPPSRMPGSMYWRATSPMRNSSGSRPI